MRIAVNPIVIIIMKKRLSTYCLTFQQYMNDHSCNQFPTRPQLEREEDLAKSQEDRDMFGHPFLIKFYPIKLFVNEYSTR